jgi:outer membrane protein TolC
MQKLLETTEASVRAGASEQINADKLNVQVASMQNTIRSNERTLKMLYNSMLLLLGADVDAEIELTTPLEEVLDVNYAARLTMGGFNIEDNYDYQLLQQSEALSRRQLTLAWMDFTPTLSAYYQYSAKTYFGKEEGMNMTPPNMVGVSVSWSILTSGTRYASIKSARIALKENQNSRKQAEDGLRVQYNQLRYDLVNALETYDIQHRNLEVTQRVFANVSEKYKYGRASSLEVTTSSNDIIAAQNNYIQAVMNVISAQTALENLLNKQ